MFSSTLGIEMALEQDFEKGGPDGTEGPVILPEELAKPAMLRTFVIGLSGVFTGSRLTSIGLVVRKIKDQKIFSYFWVQDALDAQVVLKEELRWGYFCLFAFICEIILYLHLFGL